MGEHGRILALATLHPNALYTMYSNKRD